MPMRFFVPVFESKAHLDRNTLKRFYQVSESKRIRTSYVSERYMVKMWKFNSFREYLQLFPNVDNEIVKSLQKCHLFAKR